jgi:plasmid stabilization system protein ParE
MTHKVLLTPRAAGDAEAVYRWIARDAPDTAIDWYNGLLDAFDSLNSLPNRCPLAREAPSLRRDVRQLLYGKYRILFVIEGKLVRILHVRHGARRDVRRADLAERKPPKEPPE